MKNKLMDLLLGKPAPDDGAMQVSMDYGKDLQNYMNTLPQQSYAQNLYNGNLTKEQVNQGIANGLNFGIPQIKAKQEELKIRVPQTQAEVELARNGQFNNYPLVTSINNAPRQGGLLQDFKGGFDENINQPFGVSNLEPNRNKNLATRFGEGLGTTVRLLDNPLVRGAVAYGLSKRFGDRNPLEQGILASSLNMQNKTADKLYRSQLRNLGMSEDDINSIRGYISSDTYKNIADSYKARWNKASWGDLAAVNPVIAEAVKNNPELANSYLPASVANTILKGELTDAQIAHLMAKTKETESRIGVAKQNADTNALRTKYYGKYVDKYAGGSDLENEDLSEFVSILGTRDKKKIEYARSAYIKQWGKDPYKLIKE